MHLRLVVVSSVCMYFLIICGNDQESKQFLEVDVFEKREVEFGAIPYSLEAGSAWSECLLLE